jgi:hypothetical protein
MVQQDALLIRGASRSLILKGQDLFDRLSACGRLGGALARRKGPGGVCHKTEKPSVILLSANSEENSPDLRAVSSVRSSNIERENRKMTPAIGGVGVLIVTSLGAFGQPANGAPAFEAALVKPAIGRWFGGDAGRIDYQHVTLKGLIMRAYGVKDYQITGPDWLDSAGYDVGYDIVAAIPHDTTAAQPPQMLQAIARRGFRSRTNWNQI